MEHEQQEVRWGFLSTARIAQAYANAIKLLADQKPKHRIVAVASRSLDRAKEWAEKNGVPKYYGSYEELLKDSEINAVYIPLPVCCSAIMQLLKF